MSMVFISYSHKDSSFVEKLAIDLRASKIPATYDRWILKIGDSIIERIANAVTSADSVIVVLSRHSVESNWVKKELALALTSEIQTNGGKVIPLRIDDCAIPTSISDKLYADCSINYYTGLRDIVCTLNPKYYYNFGIDQNPPKRIPSKELECALLLEGLDELRNWFYSNSNILIPLFGTRWAVSEEISDIEIGEQHNIDFLIINGQSGRYDITLISLGQIRLCETAGKYIEKEVARLRNIVDCCNSHEDYFKRDVALRMRSSYGADQLLGSMKLGNFRIPLPPTFSPSSSGIALNPNAVLLCGRQSDYDGTTNEVRNRIYVESNQHIEVISYDRLLNAVRKSEAEIIFE